MESLFLFHLPSSVKSIDSMEFVSFLSVAMTVLTLPALLLQLLLIYPCLSRGSSGASDVKKKKKSACNTGDLGSIPGSGRFLEKRMATHSSIPVSCLENSMDRGAWQATVHGVAKSRT